MTDLRAWGRAESVARAAIASATDHARGATHFHADYVSPAWARALCPTARIGRHIFYRECTPTAGLRTEIGL